HRSSQSIVIPANRWSETHGSISLSMRRGLAERDRLAALIPAVGQLRSLLRGLASALWSIADRSGRLLLLGLALDDDLPDLALRENALLQQLLDQRPVLLLVRQGVRE